MVTGHLVKTSGVWDLNPTGRNKKVAHSRFLLLLSSEWSGMKLRGQITTMFTEKKKKYSVSNYLVSIAVV